MSAEGNLPSARRSRRAGIAIATAIFGFVVGIAGFAAGWLLSARHVTQVVPSPSGDLVAYILEGKNAKVSYTSGGKTAERTAQRRTGVYLEPGEQASITAAETALVLMLITVPKHTGKAAGNGSAAGYFFEETELRSLIDEKGFRERTFWRCSIMPWS